MFGDGLTPRTRHMAEESCKTARVHRRENGPRRAEGYYFAELLFPNRRNPGKQAAGVGFLNSRGGQSMPADRIA